MSSDDRLASAEVATLLRTTTERALGHLAATTERAVAPSAAAVRALDRFDEALPESACDALETLALLDDVGSPATIASTGGRYFGFVIGGSLPVTVAASWLATAWDQNAALASMSPVAAAIEGIAERWLCEILGLPCDATAAFVTGATMASFTGLAAARHAVLARAGWDVEADGLFGAPSVRVIVGAECHTTIRKALGLLGLGRDRVVVVPSDDQGAMIAARLPRPDGPTIVCAQAGNVNSGAFDPLGEICAWARDAGAWVHVDGAFGLWAAAAPGRRHLVEGIERADSWATDGHKWLNVPYDSGIAFVRDAESLRAAMAATAAYLPPSSTTRDGMALTPDSSRRARAVDIWAALRTLGRSGVADLIERCCRYAARFAAGLRAAGHEVLNDVVLNQVVVSFGEDATTRRVIAAIQEDGTCWCGGTEWRGKTAMRISVSSWATTADDVERSLAAILRIAALERSTRA